ncbi:MAG: diguanylate cyclase [Magnetospiraceae bacterium]
MGSLMVPVGLFTVAVLILFNLLSLPQSMTGFVHAVPYVSLFSAMALGYWFHRSRVVFMALLLLTVHWFLRGHYVDTTPGYDALGQVAYAGLAVLIPINVIFITFMEERGIFTEKGVARLAGLALQAIVIAALANTDVWLTPETATAVSTWAADLLHFRIFEKDYDLWTFLPQPALHLFILAFGAMLYQVWRSRRAPAMEAGLLGATVAVAVALHLVGQGQGSSLFLGVAGLSLLLSMAQDSYRMAFVDELTGLPSRRALENEMKRLGRNYAIAMLDVDHFKKFNDTYGHDVGDQVLRMVAGRLERGRRFGGRPFRYGGEEFTMVYPNLSRGAARERLDRVREDVANASFVIRDKDRPKDKPEAPQSGADNQTVSVTISIGVAEPDADHPTPAEVIKGADEALYRAKDGGRNRVSE